MTNTPISRRTALSLLSALPFAARAAAQARPQALRRVFPGWDHALILEPDGTMEVWTRYMGGGGNNASGEMGLGHADPVSVNTMYSIPGLQNVATAAAGRDYSFAVLADGRVLSWGTRARGILGITPLAELEVNASPRPDASSPTPVLVLADAVTVSTENGHALALTRDGRAYAWGDGSQSQLGLSPLPVVKLRTNPPRALDFVPYPILVPDLVSVIAVSAGDGHSLALLEDGTIRAWGSNRMGQVGDGTTVDRPAAVLVSGIRTAVAIAAGSQFSAALLSDGTVMTWGSDGGGLGRNAVQPGGANPIPAPADGVKGIHAIAIGHSHVLGLTDSHTIVSWGVDQVGQVGHGAPTVPREIAGLANVQSIAANRSRSFAVLSGGTIMTWGQVPRYARPRGDPQVSPVPIPLVLQGLSNP